MRIFDDTGDLANDVVSIRFEFETGANARGTATYTEFDIIGRPVPPSAPLVHPGLSHKKSDLERMKYMVEAGVEPYATSFQILAAHPRARFTVEVAGGMTGMTVLTPSLNRFLANDGLTAYYNALMWAITEDSRHAEKAIEVFAA